MNAPSSAVGSLEQLAKELHEREWQARLVTVPNNVVLHVVNPISPSLMERITCSEDARGWQFYWSWREVVGPADDVKAAADLITKVLAA